MAETYDETKLKAMKVQELKEILGGLGQSQAGLKAELVARILESQNQTAAPESTSAAAPPQPESTPLAVPPTTTPITTTDKAQTPAVETTESAEPAAAPEKPALDVDAEFEKRKARAAKFGIVNEDDSVDKKLERAKRFGTGSDAVASSGMEKLDQALSDRREKRGGGRGSRGRGRGGRQSTGRQGGGSSESKPTSASAPTGSGYAKSTDPAELEKQAKRAARFQSGPEDSKKQKV